MPVAKITLRTGTSVEWATSNPVLLAGEMGIEFATNGERRQKVGDGVSPWLALPYVVGPVLSTGTTNARPIADRFADTCTPKDFGAKGDGIADDTTAFMTMFDAITSNSVVDLCGGYYKLAPTADDYTPFGLEGWRQVFLLLSEKKNITFKNGSIDIAPLPLINSNFIIINKCENITFDNVYFTNGFIPTPEYADIYGMWFLSLVETTGCSVHNCIFEFIQGGAVITTGDLGGKGIGSAEVSKSYRNSVCNNVFHWYQQCSTGGAGTNDFIFANNICINAWGSSFKVSENHIPHTDATTKNNNISLIDNIMSWTDDFVPCFTYDGVTKWFQCGVMLESNAKRILIQGNIIELTNNAGSVEASACIYAFYRAEDGTNLKNLQDQVSIINNILYSNWIILRFSPKACVNVDISGNTLYGKKVNILGDGADETRYKSFNFNNNVWNEPATDYTPDVSYTWGAQNMNYEYVRVSGNSFPKGLVVAFETYEAHASVNDTIETLYYDNNIGSVTMFVQSKVDDLRILNSDLYSLTIDTKISKLAISHNNFSETELTGIAMLIDVDNTETVTANISYNVHAADYDGGSATLKYTHANGSTNLLLMGNSYGANSPSPFSLSPTVTLLMGSTFAWGTSPEGEVQAQLGVTCISLGGVGPAAKYFYKTTTTGTTGWVNLLS